MGFLESGKTKFIQETFEDPNFDSGDKTLLLICEEGEEEYLSLIHILLEATSLSDLLARMDMVGEVIAYNKQVQADMTACLLYTSPK